MHSIIIWADPTKEFDLAPGIKTHVNGENDPTPLSRVGSISTSISSTASTGAGKSHQEMIRCMKQNRVKK